ncbi:DUF4142 domain-containing protein [Sphingobacterium corticibacter]|uniref:DUF305 domain-containing protein n=1 Tax=Sphingobacterium corticibacter TaxID=2171749 RepID=A0A2T8HGU7_9SPHI|nr:DUF4142 domain-containing protein [Sphingobacterium corticibacter]PVH24542.1 DUF305 domain-containing protein [Sphingobacterium corticibacter]
MKNVIYPLAVSAILAATACNNSANKTDGTSDTTMGVATTPPAVNDDAMSNAQADTAFVRKAAIGGMAEVEMSKLAVDKSSNAKVKEFATMMVNDHTKVNEELKSIADQKNVMVPTSLDAAHEQKKQDLMKKQGADFDKAYIEAMVKGHEDAHNVMEDGAKNNLDQQLRDFAAKTEPVVKQHLEMVKKMHADMK